MVNKESLRQLKFLSSHCDKDTWTLEVIELSERTSISVLWTQVDRVHLRNEIRRYEISQVLLLIFCHDCLR